jgi:hypothetical protein
MNLLKKILSAGPGLLPLSALLLLLPAGALAGPVTWTLQGVTFADGGTATGSFVYDATANLYSSINLITTAGSKLNGATYAFLDPSQIPFEGPMELAVVTLNAGSLTNTPDMSLFWIVNLTNAGGTVGFSTSLNSAEGSCLSATCSSVDQNPADYRIITAGSITSAPTPEPSTLMLVGCAVGVLGWRRFRPSGLKGTP